MFRVSCVLGIGLLSACSFTPEYKRPELPVPQAWSAGATTETQNITSTHWRTFFPDPQLQVLIAAALEYNRDLRVAAARVEEARAQFGVARADRLPTVGLSATGSAFRSTAEVTGEGKTRSNEAYDASLSAVSFELDFWGRIASLSQAARLNYLASNEARRSVHLSLIADVASAYFTKLQMSKLAEQARRALDLREQSLALIAQGVTVGGAYEYEYLQASGLVESARADVASIDHQKVIATNRLNYLVGAVALKLPADGDLDAQGLDVDVVPGLPSEVLLMRPDVMAAEQRLRASNANIGAARAAFLPKVLLTAGLGVASQGLAALYGGSAWNFQPTISMPLFDNGRTASSVDLAQARKVVAVAEYERTIQLAFREVSDLLSARTSLTRQLKAASLNAQAQEKRLQIAKARYGGGLVSYLEVLDAQREFISSQQIMTQMRRAQLDAAAQLYKALGGGTQTQD